MYDISKMPAISMVNVHSFWFIGPAQITALLFSLEIT